jgi:hypothetical protein
VDDTLTLFLPKYAFKINSDWIITITAGVFALARVKLMTCTHGFTADSNKCRYMKLGKRIGTET